MVAIDIGVIQGRFQSGDLRFRRGDVSFQILDLTIWKLALAFRRLRLGSRPARAVAGPSGVGLGVAKLLGPQAFVSVVVAVNDLGLAGLLKDDQQVGDLVQEVAVVADNDGRCPRIP